MVHEVIPVGVLQCNCSLCGDEGCRDAFLIDPGAEWERILKTLERIKLNVWSIILTHGHIDHIGAVSAMQQITGAPVYLHPADLPLVENAAVQAAMAGMDVPEEFLVQEKLADGDVLKLDEVELHVLHTPGHTPGSVCLWEPKQKILISGDTLFRESVGRTDLPGGDSRQLLASIREKLLPLPDETRVFPGHGPETTIGNEKLFNPFLRELG